MAQCCWLGSRSRTGAGPRIAGVTGSAIVTMLGLIVTAVAERKPAASEATGKLCFSRVYDAAHLAAHPRQLVTAIAFAIRRQPRDIEHPLPYRMTVKLRGSNEIRRGTGDCGFRDQDGLEINGADDETMAAATTISCTARPDDGAVVIKRKGGKAFLDLRGAKHVIVSGSCGSAACRSDLAVTADDKTFLMTAAPQATCAAQ